MDKNQVANVSKDFLKGTVKWFSKDKGYGFIVADDGREHYFNVRDIRGVDLPVNRDRVTFISVESERGLRASTVTIIDKGPVEDRHVQRNSGTSHTSSNASMAGLNNGSYTPPYPSNNGTYYGKATYKKESGSVKHPGMALAGLAVGSLLGGPVGGVIGGLLLSGGSETVTGKLITSSCLRCGGVGNVTNIDKEYIGFQCQQCKRFWKRRNSEGLSMSDVIR